MVRMQVQLKETQLAGLRRLASASGKSVADLIRQGVDLYLAAQSRPGQEERIQRALRAAGRFSSGSRDGSAEHDRYLAEAFRE
jgi:hypothetical protein